jgi:hypothetical protein
MAAGNNGTSSPQIDTRGKLETLAKENQQISTCSHFQRSCICRKYLRIFNLPDW